jgi:outer membrane protein TolC
MRGRNRRALVAVVAAVSLITPGRLPLTAQTAPVMVARQPQPAPQTGGVQRLTLEEAKQRALANNKVIALAATNAEGKDYAIRAAQADYFPKLIGSTLYFHFDHPLGTVLTTRSRPLLGIPANQVAVNIINRDQSLSTVSVAQPITALLKVRQGVRIAQADEQIAQAQLEKARRAVLVGVEQLYWGLLAARRIRDGARAAVQGSEATVAKADVVETRIALQEARQALQAAEAQVADVQEQLNALLDLPLCTQLEPVEPPLPTLSERCADELVPLALSSSPELREAEQNVLKAQAAVKAAKVDYLPNVNAVAGYAHQEGIPTIQPNISYVGVQGSVTFFEWGKRKNVVRERETTVILAQQKVAQTQDEIAQKTHKAFREVQQGREALQNAEAMVKLRKEASKKATGLKAMLDAGKDELTAEVEVVKADLVYRTAYSQLMSLIGR